MEREKTDTSKLADAEERQAPEAGTDRPGAVTGLTGPAGHRRPAAEKPAGLTEAERVARVVQWLTEAAAAGEELSGAEATRRLAAASTGQRAIRRARAALLDQGSAGTPARLRSVSTADQSPA